MQFENEALEKAYLKFKHDWECNEIFEVLSSGSTGKPKIISITKDQMFLSALKTIQFFSLENGLKALACLSLDTIAGKMMMARSFVGNWSLKIVEPSSNPLKYINESFDFVAFVPMQLERILKETPQKLNLIKTIIVGGAPVSDFLINELKKKHLTVFQTFGMTETISHIALRKIGFETDTFYTTVADVNVSESDGNLIIHYPEISEKSICTNDVVKIHSSQKFEWFGRSDFIINSGGVKLNPETIEKTLEDYIPFSFFLTGLKDEILGQKLALIIEGPPFFRPTKLELLKLLDKYELPKVYQNMDQFSRTTSGKLNRLQTLKNLKSNEWEELV